MHVAPASFRSARRDGITMHFARLHSRVWVLAEFPATGSDGSFVEAWCDRPHWGLVIAGDVELDLDGKERSVSPGTVFHVPAGVRHRFHAGPDARVAGLESLEDDAAVDDRSLREAGFEIPRSSSLVGPRSVAIVEPRPSRPPAAGEIVAEAWRMGELVLTRTRLGRRAGYTSEPCDQPHWGVVTVGSIAIEWEDDVEIVGPGDVFHCPEGPPGHRIEAAEAATIVDFTPVDAIRAGGRVAGWRVKAAEAALRRSRGPGRLRVDLAALG